MTDLKAENITQNLITNVLSKDMDKYFILIFTADWISQSTIVETIAQKIANAATKAQVIILDANDHEEAFLEYNVTNLPTCIIIQKLEILHKIEGVFSKKVILDLLN